MIDFKKLMDPAERARLRAEQDAHQAALEEKDRRLREAIDVATRSDDTMPLTDTERRFVASCRARLNSLSVLSDKQESWLFDIARRCTMPPPADERRPPADNHGKTSKKTRFFRR